MSEIEKGYYSLHPEFNPAHRTVKIYNWIVNQIKEESHPVCFQTIFSKIQHDFTGNIKNINNINNIKNTNNINKDEPPSKEQTIEGLKSLLAERLIVSNTN